MHGDHEVAAEHSVGCPIRAGSNAHPCTCSVRITIPGLRLISEANTSEHWAKRATRTKQQKHVTWLAVQGHLRPLRASDSASVTITRIIGHRGQQIDSDNLQGAGKHCRDSIAKSLGIDDRDPRVVWQVMQRRAANGVWSVEISVEVRDA